MSKALNWKTSGLLTPIKAFAPGPDHSLPDALTLKALVLSLYYHWVNGSLERWALDPNISRPPFKELLPSTSSHKTYNPYSILWPGILLQKKKHKTPLNGFIVALNSFEDARVASHLTLIKLGSRVVAQNKPECCQNYPWYAEFSFRVGFPKRASCGTNIGSAPFPWLNYQVKHWPAFIDQVITEHTSLNTSYYKMCLLRDLQGQSLQRTKDSHFLQDFFLVKKEIYQHYVNPCLSYLKSKLSRWKVYRMTGTELLLMTVTSQWQGPSFHHLHILNTARAPEHSKVLFHVSGMPSHNWPTN